MVDENLVEKLAPECAEAPEEYLEGDVNIQCVQSSDFIVGKQTNFNGPVTLINCTDAQEEGNPTIKSEPQNEEKIIIRNEVLSQPPPTTKENVSVEGNHQSQEKFRDRMLSKLKKVSKILILVCIGLLATLTIALTVFLVTASTERDTESEKIGSHAFYTKKAWGGKPPRSTVEMKLPIPYAVVSHSVTTQCFHLKACALLIQNMQDYHLALDFADIGYNFLVDSKGNIYEGRGWNIRNVKGGFVNGRNIDICLIGDYSEGAYPTESLMDGLKDLLEFGVETGKLSKTYSLIASNSTYSTLSPGINVYVIIKNWPHFDPDPKSHVKDFDE